MTSILKINRISTRVSKVAFLSLLGLLTSATSPFSPQAAAREIQQPTNKLIQAPIAAVDVSILTIQGVCDNAGVAEQSAELVKELDRTFDLLDAAIEGMTFAGGSPGPISKETADNTYQYINHVVSRLLNTELDSHRETLAFRQQILVVLAAEGSNVAWTRALAHYRIAESLIALDNLTAGLTHYRLGESIVRINRSTRENRDYPYTCGG